MALVVEVAVEVVVVEEEEEEEKEEEEEEGLYPRGWGGGAHGARPRW